MKGPIEPFVDVTFQRDCMAVVEMESTRLGFEFVNEFLSGLYDFKDPVHVGRMKTVKVDGVCMGPPVSEVDPELISFGASHRGSRNLTVVRPGWEVEPWRNLDFLVNRKNVPLPQHPAIGQFCDLAVVEVVQELGGIEHAQIDLSNGGEQPGIMRVAFLGIGARAPSRPESCPRPGQRHLAYRPGESVC